MKIEFLLTAIYLGLLLILLPKMSFVKLSGLSSAEARLLLLFKIVTGLAGAWYFSQVFTNSDYWGHNEEGKVEFALLLNQPGRFFTEFNTDISKYGLGGLFDTSASFWGYLRFTLLFKVIAFMNFMSQGNFYLNSAIFCSWMFFGHLAFFRVYNDLYPGRKWITIICSFFIPSLLLYTSCVHKDGFVFLSLGLTSYIFYNLVKYNATTLRKAFLFIVSLACIFLFRNYVLVALLPALAIAFLAGRLKQHRGFVVAGMYLLAAFIFFASGMLKGSFNLPAAVVKRKADFSLLEKGVTNLPMKDLTPDAVSFAENIPVAIAHVLLRPYPGEFRNMTVVLASVELYLYLALALALVVIQRKKLFTAIHPFNIYGFSFFLIMVIIIGLTIPNLGAIARYRSLLWVFVLCPIACNMAGKMFKIQNV